jgi:hypothetical protein
MEQYLQQLRNMLTQTESQLFRLSLQRDGLLNQIHAVEQVIKSKGEGANGRPENSTKEGA